VFSTPTLLKVSVNQRLSVDITSLCIPCQQHRLLSTNHCVLYGSKSFSYIEVFSIVNTKDLASSAARTNQDFLVESLLFKV
jgi:hypothetical protein